MQGRAIIITGPVGSGKSTTAAALSEVLEQHDVSCAMIDVDYLRWFHPRQPDDRFGSKVGQKHLRVMGETYRELGIANLILADVIETSAMLQSVALPDWEITVVRLEVAIDRLDHRLRGRESEQSLAWYLHRARELQQIMIENGIGDIVVPVADESPTEVATIIARRLGLIPESRPSATFLEESLESDTV